MAGRLDRRGIAGMLFDHGADALDAFAATMPANGSSDLSMVLTEYFPGDWTTDSGSLRMAGTADFVHKPSIRLRIQKLAKQIRTRDHKAINRSEIQVGLARTIILARAGISFNESYNTQLTRQVLPVLISAMTLEHLGRNVAIHSLANFRNLPKPYDLETLLKLAATCNFGMRDISRYGLARVSDAFRAWTVNYTETDSDQTKLYDVAYDGRVRLGKDLTLSESVIRGLVGQKISTIIDNPYWDLLGIKITRINENKAGYSFDTDANYPRNLYVLDNPMEQAREAV